MHIVILLLREPQIYESWFRYGSCIGTQAFGGLIETCLFGSHDLTVYLFKIFLYRAGRPFQVDLYLGYLYRLNCLELELLMLASHFLIVLVQHRHLMLGLLACIQDDLLLIANIFPKWASVGLLEYTAYQLWVIALHNLIPVDLLSYHTQKVIDWLIFESFLLGREVYVLDW